MGQIACCFDDTIGVNQFVTVPDRLRFEFVNDTIECRLDAAFTLTLKNGIWSYEGENKVFGPFSAQVVCGSGSSPSAQPDFNWQWAVRNSEGICAEAQYTAPAECWSPAYSVSDAVPPECCGAPGWQTISVYYFACGCASATSKDECCPCSCGCDYYDVGPNGEGAEEPRADGPACHGSKCLPQVSQASVRYFSGQVMLSATDLSVDGYGAPWGHTRSFSNRMTVAEANGSGFNWQVREWPYLVIDYDGNVAVLGRADSELRFDRDGTNFVPLYGIRQVLTLDESDSVYRLHTPDGTVTEFDQASGLFARQTAPGGAVIEVTDLAGNGFNIA